MFYSNTDKQVKNGEKMSIKFYSYSFCVRKDLIASFVLIQSFHYVKTATLSPIIYLNVSLMFFATLPQPEHE